MSRVNLPSSYFSDCLTIGEAAEFLGVSAATLRNWDRSGKLKPRRHPQNGYRIYLHEDLAVVLQSAELSVRDNSPAPQVDWSKMGDAEHFVQFYESEQYLIESVRGYIGAALCGGDCALVVATKEHRYDIERKLVATGADLIELETTGRYVFLDAAELLSQFMVDGMPDARLFEKRVGRELAQMIESGRRVRAFGEMVSLLWERGNRDGAIALEQLWNDLGKRHQFALFCAYPLSAFANDSERESLSSVCACHSRVIPAESYAGLETEDERLRTISVLQQKAQSLEAEIQHRQEVQKALVKRERELSDFFENAIEGLHKVGADGTILWANRADYGLLGYSADEYIGRPIADFHADADVIAEILQWLGRGETLVNFPARLRCKNGAIKHVQISSNACIEDGVFLYTRCFTRDVTQQVEAEKTLREAVRRKDEFLATLSHELRNPLAPMRSALELLNSPSQESVAAKEATNILHRQLVQLTRLVDDLLDIGRVSCDKMELCKSSVDLAAIIQSAIETVQPSLEAARHELIVSLPSRPIQLNADAGRLSQVFSNLLNNAVKFTPTGGKIWIEARQNGHEAVVCVRDNGIGVSSEALAYVFDMFRQADLSLERSQGGLGIGLTLVRRLVELHGGTVKAQSRGNGMGSEFMVSLPAESPKPRIKENSTVTKVAAAAKRRVLVVDDNFDSGDTLAMLLRIKGHDVSTARDGFEAIRLASEFNPEVILMDVGMPKLNGYDATRQIRDLPQGRNIYIVALTGWGQASDIARSFEAGCSAHLVKPVDFAALDELLAAVPASG